MNNQELLIYIIEAAILLAASLILYYKKFFSTVSIERYLFIFLSSIILSLVSAKVGMSSFESDSRNFLFDAKLLSSFLEKDVSLYGLFFLTGGNSLYPASYFPMLDASNTWANYSSFTIEKYYLFFTLISKSTLFNVSLFFGFLSFIAKLLLIKTAIQLKADKYVITWLTILFSIGGTDLYFISGLYKESLLFFFVSYFIYYFFTEKSKIKHLLAVFILIQFTLLKFEFATLFALICVLNYLWQYIRKGNWQERFISLMVVVISLGILYLSPFYTFIMNRIYRFSFKQIGNTAKEISEFDSNIITNIKSLIINILSVFYAPLADTRTEFIAIEIYNLLLGILLLVLIVRVKLKNSFLFFLLTSLFICSIFIIAFFVPNFGAQLRYRSPFVLLFVFSLILNQKYIKKINI